MKESYLIAENKALREINQRLQAEIKTNEWAYVNDYITPLNRIADALEKIAEALQATTKYHEIKEQL